MKNKVNRFSAFLKKHEFSKKAFAFAAVIIGIIGVYAIFRYYSLCKLAIQTGASVLPSEQVPVICITAILGLFLQYCLYQFGLKNSRNKYGVDKDGIPFKDTIKKIARDIIGDKSDEESEDAQG